MARPFRPKTNHICHQKPNPSCETVPLSMEKCSGEGWSEMCCGGERGEGLQPTPPTAGQEAGQRHTQVCTVRTLLFNSRILSHHRICLSGLCSTLSCSLCACRKLWGSGLQVHCEFSFIFFFSIMPASDNITSIFFCQLFVWYLLWLATWRYSYCSMSVINYLSSA